MNRALALATVLAFATAAACGGNSESSGTGGSAGMSTGGSSTGGSSTGGSSTGGSSTGGTGGASTGGSAGSVADAGNDGGPFVSDAGAFNCGACSCDGATHYCVSISAGMMPPPPADAGTCPEVTDPGAKGCHPLPSACAGIPACGCLPSPMPGYGACYCDDVGGGLQYSCALP